jgi:hypothetical protein
MDNSQRPEDMFINDPAQAEAMKLSSPYVAMFDDYMKKGEDFYKDIPQVGQVPEMSGMGQVGGVPEVPNMFKRMEKSREVKHWEQKMRKQALYNELGQMTPSQLEGMINRIEKAMENKATKREPMKKQKAMIKSFSPDLRKALLRKGMSVNEVSHIEKEFKTNLPPEAIAIMNSYVDTAVRKGWGGAAIGGLVGAGGGPLGIALGAYIGHKLGDAVGRGQISSKQAKVAQQALLQRSQNELTSQKIIDKALNQYLNGTAAAGGPAAPPSISQQILGRVMDRFLPPKTAAPAPASAASPASSNTSSSASGAGMSGGGGSTGYTGQGAAPKSAASSATPNTPPSAGGSPGANRWEASAKAGLKRQAAAQKAAQTRASKPRPQAAPQQPAAQPAPTPAPTPQQAPPVAKKTRTKVNTPPVVASTPVAKTPDPQAALKTAVQMWKKGAGASPRAMAAFLKKNGVEAADIKPFINKLHTKWPRVTKMMKGEVNPMKPQSPIELKKAINSVNRAIDMIKKEAPWTKEDPSMSPAQEQSGGEEKDIKWLSHALEGGGLDSLSKHPVVGENIGNAADKVGSKFLEKIQEMGKSGSFDHADPKAIGLAILESIDGMANDGGDEKIGKAWTGAMASLIDKYGKKVVADVAQGLAQDGGQGQFRKAVAEPIGPNNYPAKNKKTAKTDFGGQSEVFGDGTNMDTESLTENSKLLETE